MPLLLLFGMMFLAADPAFRSLLASIVAPFLDPLIDLGVPFYIVVLILASFTGIYASFIQKFTTNWKLQHKIRERQKRFGVESREAQASGDRQRIEKLNEERKEMMQDSSQMSSGMMKPMMYTLVITWPIFMWMWHVITEMQVGIFASINAFPTMGIGDLSGAFTSQVLISSNELFFNLPFAGKISMAGYIIVFPAWLMWYLLYSFTINQVIRKAYKIGFPQ